MSATPGIPRRITIQPLTGKAFAPFGQVIEVPANGGLSVNDGTARRIDAVAALDLLEAGGRPLISLFRAMPCRLPLRVGTLERHPLSSQAFLSLSRRPFLVVVAPAGDVIDANGIRAFRAVPGQGINYAPGVWHHALLALEDVSDFAVIGREAADENCDFCHLAEAVLVEEDAVQEKRASPKPRQALVDLYYEDVMVGDEVRTDPHLVTTADILAFADVTRDHHPLHTDEEYCRRTGFGRPIAHGLFGLSLIEGLKSELKLYENTSVASLGWDKVRFRRPLFAGDAVHVRVVFDSKRESRSGPHGIAVEKLQLLNQRDEVVIEAEHATLLYRRPAGDPRSAGKHA